MDFTLSQEQRALRDTARSYFAGGRATWAGLVGLDWTDPVLGPVELAVLAEEAGYALYPGPWFSTVALTLPAFGAARAEPATLAWTDAAPGGATSLRGAAATTCQAKPHGAGWLVSGTKARVPDAAAAADVVVVAGTPDGAALLAVPAGEIATTERFSVDGTRPLFELCLEWTEAELLVPPAAAGRVLRETYRRAMSTLAAEAVGVARRAQEIAVARAGSRTQFGRPVGSFQAVSHRIADLHTDLELARSLSYRAAWCVAEDVAEADAAVAAAAVSSRQAAVSACEGAMQVLGGIGFTWEHPIHRYYRRAQWIAGFEISTSALRAELAATLLAGSVV